MPTTRFAPLNADSLAAATKALVGKDYRLRRIYEAHGVPPMWARRPGFSTLLQIIIEQQVSLVSARSMVKRLTQNIQPFTPARFIELNELYLRSLGLTRQKSHYCVQLAQAFVEGRVNKIGGMSDEEAHAALVSIKGIGTWSANVYLLMALKRPDIWPNGDVALATAAGKLLQLPVRPSFVELERIAEAWRPYRSVAARMLWHYYLQRSLPEWAKTAVSVDRSGDKVSSTAR